MLNRILLSIIVSFSAVPALAQDDPFDGALLYADVERYTALGTHRFGTPGDYATTAWLSSRLKVSGLTTTFQSFKLGKQYSFFGAEVGIDGKRIPALPFWWPPENAASFDLQATIDDDSDASAGGQIVWKHLAFDGGAYMSE